MHSCKGMPCLKKGGAGGASHPRAVGAHILAGYAGRRPRAVGAQRHAHVPQVRRAHHAVVLQAGAMQAAASTSACSARQSLSTRRAAHDRGGHTQQLAQSGRACGRAGQGLEQVLEGEQLLCAPGSSWRCRRRRPAWPTRRSPLLHPPTSASAQASPLDTCSAVRPNGVLSSSMVLQGITCIRWHAQFEAVLSGVGTLWSPRGAAYSKQRQQGYAHLSVLVPWPRWMVDEPILKSGTAAAQRLRASSQSWCSSKSPGGLACL